MKPLRHYEGIKVKRVIRSEEDMHLFQRKAKRFLKHNPMSALFIDLGMRKANNRLAHAQVNEAIPQTQSNVGALH